MDGSRSWSCPGCGWEGDPRSQGAVVSTARPEHLPWALTPTLVHTVRCWSGPRLGAGHVQGWPGFWVRLWDSSQQPWADPWVEMLLSPCWVLGASLLLGGRVAVAPLDLGCVLDPGPAVSCVSQGLLGFICISLVPPCAPHRTPWSSMESLRKLVSSWEHPGSDPLTWLELAQAPPQPPGKDSSFPQ